MLTELIRFLLISYTDNDSKYQVLHLPASSCRWPWENNQPGLQYLVNVTLLLRLGSFGPRPSANFYAKELGSLHDRCRQAF